MSSQLEEEGTQGQEEGREEREWGEAQRGRGRGEGERAEEERGRGIEPDKGKFPLLLKRLCGSRQ